MILIGVRLCVYVSICACVRVSMSLMCFEKIKRAKCVLFPFLSFHFFPRTEQLFYHSVMVEGPVSMSNSNGLARLAFFYFLFFIFVFYKNIFSIWKFTEIYPGRTAARTFVKKKSQRKLRRGPWGPVARQRGGRPWPPGCRATGYPTLI